MRPRVLITHNRPMKKRILAAVLASLTLSACSKKTDSVYSVYKVEAEGVRLEVPTTWRQFGARWNGLGGAPGGPPFTRFIAESDPQHEGVILGAYLSLTQIKKGTHRTDNEDMLFKQKLPGVRPAQFKGFDARSYITEYRYQSGGDSPEGIDIPMKSEGIVIDTPNAYFVLELRANTEVYDKYLPALDHAKKTLTIEL